MSNAKTKGVHHVGLTTPDLEATYRFFTGALGSTGLTAPPRACRPSRPSVAASLSLGTGCGGPWDLPS